MVHGTVGYFHERARCARRSSLITLGLSLLALGLLIMPATQRGARRLTKDSARFGFEGPEQYVRRITLEHRGSASTLSDVGQLSVSVQSKKGGGGRPSRATVGQPQPRHRFEGPGSSDADLSMRSVSRLAGVPVFQSEELVIDRLVKPTYPQALLDKNVEGKVTVQALVDTVGNVIEVQLVNSTGEALFEKAAEEAVWLCRFRPYRGGGGEASEVYAVFRFSFRIY
ncbi:MAG TPA: energy transducer TonB [Candidatus Eisenbacteria bacterium]|nr:energy transducer TonB [Candidatus Eisenbacteria bacterium]